MTIRTLGAVTLGAALVAGMFVGTLEPRVFAQTTTQVDFAIPSEVFISIAGVNDAGDALVITGRSKFVTSAIGCTTSPGPDYPIQDGVVVDPGGQRATRVATLIVIATSTGGALIETTPLKPGTKIKDVNGLGPCEMGGQSYSRYRGTIE